MVKLAPVPKINPLATLVFTQQETPTHLVQTQTHWHKHNKKYMFACSGRTLLNYARIYIATTLSKTLNWRYKKKNVKNCSALKRFTWLNWLQTQAKTCTKTPLSLTINLSNYLKLCFSIQVWDLLVSIDNLVPAPKMSFAKPAFTQQGASIHKVYTEKNKATAELRYIK